MATHPQLQKLAILRNESGLTRAEWFAWVDREIGQRITSNRELSVQQASHLIEIAPVTIEKEASDVTHH